MTEIPAVRIRRPCLLFYEARNKIVTRCTELVEFESYPSIELLKPRNQTPPPTVLYSMKRIIIIHTIFAFVSGVLLIGYGGMDDSPGAQGIGLLTAVGSIALLGYYWKVRTQNK